MTKNQKQARRDLDSYFNDYQIIINELNNECKEKGCTPGHCRFCKIALVKSKTYGAYMSRVNEFKYRFKFRYDPMYFIDEGVPDYMIWTRELWDEHLKIWQDE